MIEGLRERLWREERREGLTLIVGGSPLPNLIAALALRPPTISLVCSEETRHDVARMIDAIRWGHESVRFREFGPSPYVVLRDAYRPASVREDIAAVAPLLARDVLFYASGTKPMATHVHAAWSAAGGRPQHACYLADRTSLLVFDDGAECDLSGEVALSLDVLAKLHGVAPITFKPAGSGDGGAGPGDADVDVILDEALRRPDVAARLYDALTLDGRPARRSQCADGAFFDVGAIVAGLRLHALDESLPSAVFDEWVEVLRGTWLEMAAARFLVRAGSEIGGAVERSVHRDVNGRLPAPHCRQFQLDVAQVAGARLTPCPARRHTIPIAATPRASCSRCASALARSVVTSRAAAW